MIQVTILMKFDAKNVIIKSNKMKLEYEVLICNQYEDTYYRKKEIIKRITEWLDEEEIEEGGPHFIRDIRSIIEIKKILFDDK